MARSASARRYGHAIFQIAISEDRIEKWLSDLTILSEMFEDGHFSEVLDTPQVRVSGKVEIVQSALDGLVGQLAINLTCLLTSRGTARLLPTIADIYQELVDEHKGVIRAEVISATKLDDEIQQRIVERLKDVAGSDLVVTNKVDENIVGGFIAKLGDRVLDCSTRLKLIEMRRDLVQGH